MGNTQSKTGSTIQKIRSEVIRDAPADHATASNIPNRFTARPGSAPHHVPMSCWSMWRLRSGFEMSSIVKITKRKCNAIQFEICIHEKSIKKKRHCSGAFSAIPSSRLDFPQEPEPGRWRGLWRAGSNANTPPPKGLRGSWTCHPRRGPESLPINTANVMGGARNARPPCPGAAAPRRVCPGALHWGRLNPSGVVVSPHVFYTRYS